MPNDEEFPFGSDLPPWFAPFVRNLAGTIRAASEPGNSGIPTQNAGAFLATIRANAAEGTPGLYNAIDLVHSSIWAIEGVVGRRLSLGDDYSRLVSSAQEIANNSLNVLIDVLRRAEPSGKAKALY